MPFDWRAMLDVARLLEERSSNVGNAEALLRTALNRAYFAAYCYARNYAIQFLGFPAQASVEDHGRLRAFLKQKRRSKDGDRLEDLRLWRNESDYEDDLSFEKSIESIVSLAIKHAEKIFVSLAPPKSPT